MLYYILTFILALVIAYVILVLRSGKQLPKSLNGVHVLVTGGSSGIGKSVAKYLASKGASITLFARDTSKLESTKTEILASKSSAKVQCISIDVSKSYDEVKGAVEKAVEGMGPIKILINCAGTSMSAKVEDTKMEDFYKMMDVNYFGTVKVTNACLPYIKEKGGCILITSSLAGLFGVYGYTAYSASKFALRGFAECLAMELKPYNVYVTLNCPPDTDTPGFAEEEKMKPQITRTISESGGLVSADKVAKELVDDMFKGKFLSTCGFEGKMILLLCAGLSPVATFGQLLMEIHFMGLMRLVSFFLLRNFDGIVRDGTNKEKKSAGDPKNE